MRSDVALNATTSTSASNSRTRGIEQLKADKVYKRLNYLDSPQSARVRWKGAARC